MTAVRPIRNGRLDAIELEGDRLRVVVCPSFGGRVASLVDRAAGRDWLLPGGIPPELPSPGHDATFGRDEATGWDECLPTVSPAADPVATGRSLRDHGDVWGRHLAAELAEGRVSVTLEHAWADDEDRRYSFRRTFSINGPTLRVEYTLASRAAGPLPFLWSMHPLLALEPGARLILPGVTDALATYAVGAVGGLLHDGEASRVPWPDVTTAHGAHHLDTIPGLDAREAVKLYAGPVADGRAAVIGADASWLGFEWDSSFAPYVGVWLSHGAWPDPESGVRQAALEPTTAAADDLGAAIAAGRAVTLPRGGRLDWWARLTVGTGNDTLAGFLAGQREARMTGAQGGH